MLPVVLGNVLSSRSLRLTRPPRIMAEVDDNGKRVVGVWKVYALPKFSSHKCDDMEAAEIRWVSFTDKGWRVWAVRPANVVGINFEMT